MDGKKIFSLLICANFFFTSNYFFYPESYATSLFDINQHKSRKDKLKTKQGSIEKTLKETQKKNENTRQQYDIVNSQILETKEKKVKLNRNINNLKTQINQVKNNIADKEKAIAEGIEILKQRLVAVYKAGEVHLIDLILNAKTFEDFIDKAEIISKVSEHDNRLLNALKADVKSLEDMKNSLFEEESKLVSELESLNKTEAQLKELLSENESLLKKLEGEQAVLQAELDETDAEYKKIQNEIDRYLAEEAEKKRKEEIRKGSEVNALKLSVSSNVSIEKGNFIWPVPSCRTLSSKYNEKRGSVYHKGIDIAGLGIYGESVVAVDDGVVITSFSGCKHDYGKLRSCGCGGGYGNYVIISHRNGKVSIYGHLSVVYVTKGQEVKKGDKIGEVGSTGYSTGPHLHFQTKYNGVDYNPMNEY